MGGNIIKGSTPRVSRGCRRGVEVSKLLAQNCDQSVQIRQFGTFLPHFGHKISTLRHPFDTPATPKVSKLKTACTKGSKGITWLIYLLRHLLDFLAQLEKKIIYSLRGSQPKIEMTEEKFWDKFNEKHNSKYYNATKNKKKIKLKPKRQRRYPLFKGQS